NTQVTDQARQMALDKGVKIFQSKVIYEIFENYTRWKDELKEKQKKEALNSITRPAKIRSIPDHTFNRSKPAVVGVKVVDGILTAGSSVMTPKGDRIGKIKSVQADNQTLDKAEKGQEVAISISNATVGRDFKEGDTLVVDINGREYKQLRQLKDFLTAGEEDVLKEIIEIKDKEDPHWKLG
ncbi:MAG: translation initiation factor IF-2, partial [Nanohaloarchaea archaeon SW_10_44_10]